MSRFIIDTDILTLFKHGNPNVIRNAQLHSPFDVAVTVITVDEILTGWYTKVRNAKTPLQIANAFGHLTDSITFLSKVRIETFAEPAVLRYQALRTTFRRLGKNDLRIAAIALELGATLVTRNTKDFQQIPGLTIVDWTK